MEKTFRVIPDLMLREIAGEHLLIPVGEAAVKLSGIITLNDSGLLLWQALQQPCTRTGLIDGLLQEYQVDRETAAGDVDAFLDKLTANGLLEELPQQA